MLGILFHSFTIMSENLEIIVNGGVISSKLIAICLLSYFQYLFRTVPIDRNRLNRTLSDFLRNDLNLIGTKVSCDGLGICGACSVTINSGDGKLKTVSSVSD